MTSLPIKALAPCDSPLYDLPPLHQNLQTFEKFSSCRHSSLARPPRLEHSDIFLHNFTPIFLFLSPPSNPHVHCSRPCRSSNLLQQAARIQYRSCRLSGEFLSRLLWCWGLPGAVSDAFWSSNAASSARNYLAQ